MILCNVVIITIYVRLLWTVMYLSDDMQMPFPNEVPKGLQPSNPSSSFVHAVNHSNHLNYVYGSIIKLQKV